MEKLNIKRYLIARGNSTSLVMGRFSEEKEKEISEKELTYVEQVGFVDLSQDPPELVMMGNELCVNATLAFAKMLGDKRGEIKTSGLESPVKYRNSGEMTHVTLTLKPTVIREREIVLFDGIGYVCSSSSGLPTETYLSDLAREFELPAFGLARYQGDSLEPFVYVEKIGQVVAETACGSGSIALSLITGARTITQATGQRIEVLRSGDQFTVTAKVAKMKEKS